MSYTPPPPGGHDPAAGPPYGGPGPGYGGQGNGGYGGYPPSSDHPQGTTILVLGILSLVVCPVLGPFAWSMGNTALAEIDRSPAAYRNRGAVAAGRICGIIATALLVIAVLAVVLLLLVGRAGA